jgi:Ca-activated chloride channel family protein
MSCGEIQVRLADDVLGETSGADHEALAEHLATCAVCAEERRAFEEAVGLLREMEWPVVEPVLAAPQRERVEARAANPEPPSAGRRRTAMVTASSLAAAAVMAAIAIPSLYRARIAVPAEDLPEPGEQREYLIYSPPPATTLGAPQARGGERLAAGTKNPEPENVQFATGPDLLVAPPPTPPPDAMAAEKYSAYAYVQPGVASGVEGGVPGGVEGGVAGGMVGGMPAPPRESRVQGFVLDSHMVPREPAPARDMYFQHQGTNPFVATEVDSLSTFGLDVDTASYTVTRNYLTRGALPPPEAVRVEEFVNALAQDYAPPRNEAFAIHLEAAPHPFRRGYHLLRVGLKAREVRAHERKRANLTFVIDVSGSMGMENRLGLVQRSLRLLVSRLDERDRIGIVVYGTNGRVVLEPTPASDRRTILRAIDSLRPEGSTNLEEGLDLGYRMAVAEADPRANNRVVLCTDGVANNGVTDPATLLKRIHARAQKRVFLTALGFGMGNYNDVLLQKLADEGDGQYAYIDDDREAERYFLRDLSGVLEVVAREAKAQVQFDPAAVAAYRLLGYEKRDVADEDFRNDDVDGGEIGAGHAVTVLYELKLRDADRRLGTVNVRFVDPESGDAAELARDIEGAVLRGSFESATPGFRVAAVMARFAEHLRRSDWVKGESLEDVLAVAERIPSRALRGSAATDLPGLMREAVALSSPRGRLVPVNRDR